MVVSIFMQSCSSESLAFRTKNESPEKKKAYVYTNFGNTYTNYYKGQRNSMSN